MRSNERRRKRSRSRSRSRRSRSPSSSRRSQQQRRRSPSRGSRRRERQSRSRSYSSSPPRRQSRSRERHSSRRRDRSRTPSRERERRRSDSCDRSLRRRSPDRDDRHRRRHSQDRGRSYEKDSRRRDRDRDRDRGRRSRSSSSPSRSRRRRDDDEDDRNHSNRGDRGRDREEARRSRERSSDWRGNKPPASTRESSKGRDGEGINETKRSAVVTAEVNEQDSKPSYKPIDDTPNARVTPLSTSSSSATARKRSFDESASVKPAASTLGRSCGSSDVGESAGTACSSRNGTPHAHPSGGIGSSTPAESRSQPPQASVVAATGPALDPAMEKLRVARRESWRAHLKSTSEYNRAEMKVLALEADLEIAEFWLEMVTANLEDVGKRIEIHDWNYQKAREQHELE